MHEIDAAFRTFADQIQNGITRLSSVLEQNAGNLTAHEIESTEIVIRSQRELITELNERHRGQ